MTYALLLEKSVDIYMFFMGMPPKTVFLYILNKYINK